MFVLRRRASTMGVTKPGFEKVKGYVQAKIRSGAWRAGDPVPSEADLMARFGLSRMTVNRGMRELSAEGLVERIQGLGTFVADLQPIASSIHIRDIHEEILERGHLHATRVMVVESCPANALVAERLQLSRRKRVFHTVLLHSENGTPIQLEDRYVNPAAAPDYLHADFEKNTPTAYLMRVAPLTHAAYRIDACIPDALQAKVLRISVHEPCLRMTRTTRSGDVVVTTAELLHPATRHTFQGEFQA
jgi:GntR family histidine utilization transcriptional repressor